MNEEQAKDYIVQHPERYLQPDKSGKGFICPLCGSGSGKNGTGLTTRNGTHFTCWKGCFTSKDIIDIIGLQFGLNDFRSKLQKAFDEFGITIDKNLAPKASRKASEKSMISKAYIQQTEQDFSDFFLQAKANIEKTSYHRGISLNTLKRFNVGYMEAWTHPKAPQAPSSPRLIIPTSTQSYLARDTRDNLTDEQKKYSKSKVGRVHIFNSEALYTAQKPVFVVEGEIDALSIIDVGGEAIALGSVANKKLLLSMVEAKKPSHPLLLSLDKDEAGEKTTQELKEGLKRLQIDFYCVDILNSHKDANEALNANREAFSASVHQAEHIEDELLEAERQQCEQESVFYSLQKISETIEKSRKGIEKTPCIPTGFKNLDSLLDGGLYAGLYIVGAISSLGKTTFCLQIADQIARSGQDVLIFSLEMAREELIAKSLSRLTFMYDSQAGKANSKTTRGILTKTKYPEYSEDEYNLICEALFAYSAFSNHIYITEGIGNVGIKEIREKIQKHTKLMGRAPVVLIDYLQIIAPFDIRATDKQNIDKAVLELKRLSRDYNTPIIGISSFNRDNYSAPVNLASFKESGAIEYSSDVLIGLQYEGMDYQEGETDKGREKRIRELIKKAIEDGKNRKSQRLQIKILKNRNGSKGDVLLYFYPMFNYFTQFDDASTYSESNGWRQSGSSYEREIDEVPF